MTASVLKPLVLPSKPLAALDISASTKSSSPEASTSRPFQRLRSSLEQTLRTARRSRKTTPPEDLSITSTDNIKVIPASEDAPRKGRMLQRLPSRPTFFRGARDAVVASPAPNPKDKSEKGDPTGYTNFRAPSLRQGSVSSPALHLSSQALPSPRSRPAIPVLSSTSNAALATPPKERPPKASGSSSRFEISSPLKLGSQHGKTPDVACRNTQARHRSTKSVPVVPTSPSTPSLPSKSNASSRARDRVPVGHLDRDLPSPPGTPTPPGVSRRSQAIRSPSRAAASSSNISLVGPPSPGPQTPTRGLSPVRARSPTTRTRLVSPSRLSPTPGCSSPTQRKPFLESRRTSLDPPRRTSYDGISTRTESPASFRGESPLPAPRRAVSPMQQPYAQNRYFKVSGTSEHRELIRNATSMLCREMARPPPHLTKTENGMRDWEEVERRVGGLKRLERVWTKSGAIGLGSPSGTILNAAGEDRERNLFAEALKDGYVLCHLINKLRSSSVVRPDAREDGLFRSSNVTKFLAACASYGLPSEDLFQPDDLNGVTSKTLARVAKTVIALINYVETPLPSKILSGQGKKQTPVPVPVPYQGSMSRASASAPNLFSCSPPSSPTRKRWSPSSTLPPLKSNSSEEGSVENSPRMHIKNDIGDLGNEHLVYAKLDTVVPGIMPPPRSTLRPRPMRRTEISGASADQSHADESQNMRQSVVSTAMTETTVATVVSSILDNGRSWSGQNKYGTIRTVTTDLTSEAPSLSRTEGSNIAEDMAWRRSTDGGSKSRDRKLSETPSVARVAEEADENFTWKRDQNKIQNGPSGKPQKPEKAEKVFAVHLHKGRWPDDFMDLFDQAKPSPIDDQTPPLELDEEFLYSVPPQQALSHAEVSRRNEKVEVTEPDRMRRSQSSRHAVDNAVLMPREQSRLRPETSPEEVTPARVMLRRHSTKPTQRNAIYLPRSSPDDPTHADDDASVPFPRAASRERANGGATAVAETSSNHEQHRVLRGRFQSDVEESLTAKRIRPNVDEHFGRRSRIESMISLGVSTNASASDLRRESIDGSTVKKTIVIKEAGKPPVQYKLGNCIGRGQFGSVYRALNLSTGQTVAVKQIRLEGLKEAEVTELMREVNIYKRLSHPGIVRYEGMTRDDETLSIVLEYAENGSLGQTLKSYGKLNERLVASYVAKILEGLHYLHGQDVVHCDLKAANILTTKTGNVKLTDFGVSLNLRAMEREIKNVAGTPNWMAPEIIELKGASKKSDIWSLACTVIELLTGRPPYGEISNTMTVMFRIVEDKMPPIPEECSELAREFLLQCFDKDPTQRPSADILFEHPWLKQNWGIYKELRPQDSIPFLRRVSADLHKSEAVRFLPQFDLPMSCSPESPAVLKESPSAQSPLEQRFSASSVLPLGENDFSPREHTFVKTTFSKAMHCRVCSTDVKKAAVICSQCSLVSHSKCAPNAPPTCDLRAQLLRLAQYAEMGSPTSSYYNPADALGSSRPPGAMSDVPYVTHPENPQPTQPANVPSSPTGLKFISAFRRSPSNLGDAGTSVASTSQTRTTNARDDKVVRRKGAFHSRDKDRPLSFTSNSTGMSSVRSAATAAESFSSGPDTRASYLSSISMDRTMHRNDDSGRKTSKTKNLPRIVTTIEADNAPGATQPEVTVPRKKREGNCIVQ